MLFLNILKAENNCILSADSAICSQLLSFIEHHILCVNQVGAIVKHSLGQKSYSIKMAEIAIWIST